MLTAIERHIVDLLHQHDCVIIPELGGLVANYTPAFADEKGNSLRPPKKGFIWNKFLTHNDGLLANEIVKKDQVTYSEALEVVGQYVSKIKKELENHKRFDFSQIGFLYQGEKGQIQFEYSGKNFLMNSFGLPVVRMEKLAIPEFVKEKEAVVVEEKETKVVQLEPKVAEKKEDSKVIPIASPETIEKVIVKNSKWWIAAALIPIGFYSAWIPMKTDMFNKGGNFHYSDLNPFTFDKEKGNYKMSVDIAFEIDTLEAVSFEPLEAYAKKTSDTLNEENNVLSPESIFVDVETPELETANVTLGNYFVIGGCFSKEDNAKEFVSQLKGKGYEAVLVDVNKGLHRVAFGQYGSKEDAKEALNSITSSGEYSGWILKK